MNELNEAIQEIFDSIQDIDMKENLRKDWEKLNGK